MLVVIDMQEDFLKERNEGLVENIVNEIENHDTVILVEYDGFGKIVDEIWDAARDKSIVLTKDRDSAGGLLLPYLQDINDVTIVGVNLCACVFQTIKELHYSRYDLNITVIAECCQNDWQVGLLEASIMEFEDDLLYADIQCVDIVRNIAA